MRKDDLKLNMAMFLNRRKGKQIPEWRKHPNPYLQLHLKVYPQYLKERDAGTYDSRKDPFCSTEYILSHPFKNFDDVERELNSLAHSQEVKDHTGFNKGGLRNENL